VASTFHPRPQPHRLDFSGENADALPRVVSDSDEMFQILFEDVEALDSKVDDNADATAASLATLSGGGTRGPQGVDGADGEDGGLTLTPAAAVTVPPLTVGSVLFAGPSGAIAQDNANLFWDDTNNRLGIGTIVPDVNLDISPASGFARIQQKGTNAAIILDHTTANSFSSLSFKENGTDLFLMGTGLYTADTTNFDIGVSGAGGQRIRIQSTGNIGIGSGFTNPSSRLTIQAPNSVSTGLQGQCTINDSTTATFEIGMAESTVAPGSRTAIQFVKDATAASSFSIVFKTYNGSVGGATRMTIDKDGNVAIGASAPSTKLHVQAGNIRVATGQGLEFGGTAETIIGTSATQTIEFTSGSTARMKLTTSTFSPSSDGATNFGSTSLRWGSGFFSSKVGIGIAATLTGQLHIGAGSTTASSAPIKLTSGTVMTTAEAGAIEFTTDDFFATITTGAARKAFILDNGTRLTSGKIPIATTNGRLIDLTASSAYTPTNVTTDRAYDANATTLDEVADVLGTVIADLQAKGILG
jgi:hypothetical protein